nr:transposase, MuDR, MULE transposase domain protein [Tanacetum cinerariifolium]
MVKQSFNLNVPKDSSSTDEVAQNGGTPKSATFEIHHGGCFTPTPSRLGLDYGQRPLNVEVDVLEMTKYVKDYKIILVYVEHGSSNVDTSIFVTPKKGVAIAVDNHLRKCRIEIDSIPDVNRNLTPMCHRNLTKEWEQVSSKTLNIGEVMRILSKKQSASSEEGPIVVESSDPFEDLDEILGNYANIEDEITMKQMIVHVGNSSTVDDVLDLQMIFETKSDSEDLDYDPKHDEVFDDDEHLAEDVYVRMNNFNFNADPRHDLSIGVVEVQEDDINVIDYDSFGSDLDDGIDSKRKIHLRELKRIGPWLGQILTAVMVDANNRIYPKAFAIVEAESGASQVGDSSQAGAIQAVGARNVSGQAGRRNASSQTVGASQPSAALSRASQGPT